MKMTGYETLSRVQLHSLFSSKNWHSLSFDERISACQEVENRYAVERGVAPCNITHKEMDGASYGWQSGNTICLNTSMVREGCFHVNYKDENGMSQTARIPVMAPSWNTLDTIYHEGTHGVQEATGRMPSTYISPGMDSDLYRIQMIEKEAYAVGQSRTLDALSEVEKASGELDPARNDYFASVKNDSFQAAFQDAARHYNDPSIDSTLQSVINDREDGIVPDNPSPSYQSINTLCDSHGIHSSYSASPEISECIDDGSSSFLDESSTSASIPDYIDDGLSDNGESFSSWSQLSPDNGMSDGME